MNISLLKSIANIMIITAIIIMIPGFIQIVNSLKEAQSYSQLGVNIWIAGILIGVTGSIILIITSLIRFKKIKKKKWIHSNNR
jgi:hypothetical protein